MNDKRRRRSLWKYFFVAIIFQFTVPILIPSWRLNFFAPFLIKSFYRRGFISCLWLSLLCGVIVDLLGFQSRFGLFALSYVLTTTLLFRQKKNFFEDHLHTVPLMTFLFSVITSLVLVLGMAVLDKPILFSWRWIITDLIIMSCFDAFYAFVIFVIPALWKRRSSVEEEQLSEE